MHMIKSNFFNVRWNQDKLNGMKKASPNIWLKSTDAEGLITNDD